MLLTILLVGTPTRKRQSKTGPALGGHRRHQHLQMIVNGRILVDGLQLITNTFQKANFLASLYHRQILSLSFARASMVACVLPVDLLYNGARPILYLFQNLLHVEPNQAGKHGVETEKENYNSHKR